MQYQQLTRKLVRPADGPRIGQVFYMTSLALIAAACTSQTAQEPNGPGVDILVGSCYTNNVLRFDGDTGRYLGEHVPAGSGGLNCPEGEMILGTDGLLYVTSLSFPPLRHPWEPLLPPPEQPQGKPVFEPTKHRVTYNDQVLRYNSRTGEYVDVFIPPSPILNGPHGVAITKDGDAIVATRFSSSLLIYDSKKRAVRQVLVENGSYKLSEQIDPELVFRDLNSISLGPDGKVYVASYQTGDVFRFDERTGAILDRFVNSHDSHWMNHPHNVLFGPDGNLYVTNISEDEEHSILRFDGRTGKFMDIFVDGSNPKIGYPSDIVFSPDGSLLVVDCLNGAVLRYDGESGRFNDMLVPPGTGLPPGATSIVLLPKAAR